MAAFMIKATGGRPVAGSFRKAMSKLEATDRGRAGKSQKTR